MDISPLASVLAIQNCALGIDGFFKRFFESQIADFIPRIIHNESPSSQKFKPRTPIVILPALDDDSVFGGVFLIALLVEKTRPEPKVVCDQPLAEIKQPVVQSLATSASVSQPQQRVRRGRKPKYSPESDQRIHALWVSGQFATQNILATHLNTSLSEVKKALDRERHRRRTVVNTE